MLREVSVRLVKTLCGIVYELARGLTRKAP